MGCIESEYRRAGLWNRASHSWKNEQELSDSFLRELFKTEKPRAILTSISIKNLEMHVGDLVFDWISVVADRTENASTRIFEDANYRKILARKYAALILKVCDPVRSFAFEVHGIKDPDNRNNDFMAMISKTGEGWIFFLESTC